MQPSATDRSIEALALRLAHSVWQRKLVFLLGTAAVFAMLVPAILSQQPVYEGAVTLLAGSPELTEIRDRTRRDTETPVAMLARIAESDEVIKAAVQDVGLATIAPPLPPRGPSLVARLRHLLFPDREEVRRPIAPVDAELPRIRAGLTVRGEQNASIVRIAYRNPDPELAARFANAVAARFIARYTELYSKTGAAEFFLAQRQRFEDETKRAADALQAFSSRTSLYSIEDQRTLILKRRDAIAQSIAASKGLLTQKVAERQSLAEELRKLLPVSRSPYVSSLVDSLGGDKAANGSILRSDTRIIDDRTTDPPLLLIKVYQDSMSALFKANSDLVGVQNLLKMQADDLEGVTAELNALARNEQEFARLKGDLDRATRNLDLYSRRMIEEQINAQLSTARFSSVKVLQDAVPPVSPAAPNLPVMAALAALLSGLCGVALALLFRRRPRTARAGYEARLPPTVVRQ